MIEFNLLPDVKIAFIKAERQKKLVISISTIASVAAIALFVLLFTFVHVVQTKSMGDLTTDIKTRGKTLTDTKDLNKILTVQSQLSVLDDLHGKKIISSRMFTYLQSVTPKTTTIGDLKADYTANTLEITGNAQSLAAIYTYADSLKNTMFTTQDNNTPEHAFKDVVLTSVSVTSDKGPQYTFNLTFDPLLFQQDQTVKIETKKTSETRLDDSRPSSVFQQSGGQ
jgi:Tfp pilus assembly protein PilN